MSNAFYYLEVKSTTELKDYWHTLDGEVCNFESVEAAKKYLDSSLDEETAEGSTYNARVTLYVQTGLLEAHGNNALWLDKWSTPELQETMSLGLQDSLLDVVDNVQGMASTVIGSVWKGFVGFQRFEEMRVIYLDGTWPMRD